MRKVCLYATGLLLSAVVVCPAQVTFAEYPRKVIQYGKLPLSFEGNEGQIGSQVKFLSRGNGYTLFLTSTGAVLSLHNPATSTPRTEHGSINSSGASTERQAGENTV